MDIVISYATSIGSMALNHPVYGIIGAIVGFILLIKFYLRATLELCDCVTNMTGKTVLITGANAGIGRYTAEVLAGRGARVILACRNEKKALKAQDEIIAKTGNRQVIFMHLDLSSFASVKAFAKQYLAKETRLDVLINNAGTIGSSDEEKTKDDHDVIMQSNHLSHFLLTLLLMDLLKKSSPSRIINVSSMAYKTGYNLNLQNLSVIGKESWLKRYSCSKMANVLFTLGLAKRLESTGVTANALHPGVVKTDIIDPRTDLMSFFVKSLVFFFSKSPLEGAQTSLHLALAPELEQTTGKFFSDCRELDILPWALKDEHIEQFWKTSEQLVGLQIS